MRGEWALGSVKVVNTRATADTAEKRVSVSNSSEIVAAGPQGGMGLDLSLIHISEPTRPY